MIRCLAYVFNSLFEIRARLAAENLCFRKQLVVLKRRQLSWVGWVGWLVFRRQVDLLTGRPTNN